jgi:hypothetical protein
MFLQIPFLSTNSIFFHDLSSGTFAHLSVGRFTGVIAQKTPISNELLGDFNSVKRVKNSYGMFKQL